MNCEVNNLITHCAPKDIGKEINPNYAADPPTNFFEEISKRLKFHYWIFGHYHVNQLIKEKTRLALGADRTDFIRIKTEKNTVDWLCFSLS